MTDINKSPNWLHTQILYSYIDWGTGFSVRNYWSISNGYNRLIMLIYVDGGGV
jgi:hypothetical protein